MKISRSYLLGLGSGLILSALIAMVVPPVSINIAGGPAVDQGAGQGAKKNTDQNMDGEDSDRQSTVGSQNQPLGQGENLKGSDQENGVNTENKGDSNGKDDSDKNTNSEGKTGVTALFAIPAGSTADRIADLLMAEGWIASKEEFLNLVKERNLAGRFRAGSFELTQGMSVEEILGQLIP